MCPVLGIYIRLEITVKCVDTIEKNNWWFWKYSYIQRRKDLDLFSVDDRLLRADVIKWWKIFHSTHGICPEDIFVLNRSSITRDHRFKIVHECFPLEWRRRSFALRVASTWNSLPEDVAYETFWSFKTTCSFSFTLLCQDILFD